MHQAAELKCKCIDYINKNRTEVMLTDGWKEMIKSRVQLVLELYQQLA